MNQANNFWDFVASLQNNQGASPFAEGRGPAADFDPFQGEFWGPWARGRHGPAHGHPHHGPPGRGRGGRHGSHGRQGPHHGPHDHHQRGRPEHEGSAPPPPPRSRSSSRTPPESPAEPHERPRSRSPGGHRRPSPPPHHEPGHFGGPRRHHSPHGGRGRGGPRGGRHGPRGGHHHPRGPPHPPAFPFDLNALAEAFAPAIFGGNNPFAGNQNANEVSKTTNDGTFTPSIDLFSTPTSYIIHATLPGAKKPEIDVTYSGTRNAITISGVVTRPDVSETMMNCLVTDERREVGMFEREVKLEEGVKIDEERIGAKLEDGILRVVVPKIVQEEEEEWESVRKVELE